MADRRNVNYRHRSNTYYIEGNVARKYSSAAEEIYAPVPEDTYEHVHRRQQRQKKESRQSEVVRKKRRSVYDIRYMFFLTGAFICVLLAAFIYLHTLAQAGNARSRISALKTDLITITEENKNLSDMLNVPVDLNKVYTAATGRLGMVYAGEKQIIYYNSSSDDYVKQYNNIPED